MKRFWIKFKNEKGASLIETLFALAFISMTVGAFLNLAISAIQLSLMNKTKVSLGQHANLIAEEIVKDVTIDTFQTEEHYCGLPEVSSFLANFDPFDTTAKCAVSAGSDFYEVKLTVSLYDKEIPATRTIKF